MRFSIAGVCELSVRMLYAEFTIFMVLGMTAVYSFFRTEASLRYIPFQNQNQSALHSFFRIKTSLRYIPFQNLNPHRSRPHVECVPRALDALQRMTQTMFETFYGLHHADPADEQELRAISLCETPNMLIIASSPADKNAKDENALCPWEQLPQ